MVETLLYFLESATILTDFPHLGPDVAMIFNERSQMLLVTEYVERIHTERTLA